MRYCIFKRRDIDIWQFISGGGEDEDKSILDSVKREANEEADISCDSKYYKLETTCSISTDCFGDARIVWGEECLVIPEYSFAIELSSRDLMISSEHRSYEWVDYKTANEKLRYDSNKVALWELDNRIKLGLI